MSSLVVAPIQCFLQWVFSFNMKLPEYAAHPSLMSINKEVSTLILMYNKQHIKYCSNSIQYDYIAETV
jgi:hypothetical protein